MCNTTAQRRESASHLSFAASGTKGALDGEAALPTAAAAALQLANSIARTITRALVVDIDVASEDDADKKAGLTTTRPSDATDGRLPVLGGSASSQLANVASRVGIPNRATESCADKGRQACV